MKGMRVLAVAMLLAGGPADLAAQERGGGGTTAPVAEAARLAGAVTLDGRLDEDAWAAAEPITRFTQVDPEEGSPGSEPTEVRILYDDEALYVGARLLDSRPVSTRLGRRDAYLSDSDWFSISVDSYRDFRTAYRFMVNPSGVRSDEVLTGSDDRGGDDSWDPVWQVETAIADSGWTVEMRIPFSQLRFRPGDEQVWGIQLEREIARRQEEAVFAFTPKRERGGIARYGRLTGMSGIRPGSRLELLPYVVASAAYLDPPGGEQDGVVDPFQDGSEYAARTGVDLKYRVTSNLTLDATINPDFGQVELDPAVVNLTAVETRFDERRPFFVEGSDIFRFGGGGRDGMPLFYSRRIGAAPQLEPEDAVYEDVPDAATILGAAKLTGRTSGGWSIGILEAVSGREEARYVDATGAIRTAEVEPLTNFFVARARREMREGQTLVGGILTSTHRDLGDARVRDELRSAAYTLGGDFRHEWANRGWSVSGYLVGSHVRGEPGVMIDAQRSPARYYQRPDADYLDLDTTATSLSGYAARLELGKPAGLHWRGSLAASATSPGYEINDLGFYYDADRLRLDGNLTYVQNRPGRLLRNWRIHTGPGATWNYGGDYLGGRIWVRASGELLNYWSGTLGVSRSFGGLDDRLTRGGPLARGLGENGVTVEIRSDPRHPVTADLEARYGEDEAGGWSGTAEAEVTLRPAPNWSVSLGPELSRRRSAAQYLATVDDPLATNTFGKRYVFAGLEQTTVSMQGRLNLVFTPELTLELYVEPFLASGDFAIPMELAGARTFSFLRYGADIGTLEPAGDQRLRVDPDGDGPAASFTLRDRDFRRGSLQGNGVLRWEWRPGSTLFVVWQQERSTFDPLGELRLGPGFGDLWAAAPDNVFLVKLTYWLNL